MTYGNSTNSFDYDIGRTVCHLLFLGNYGTRHSDALQNNSHVLKPYYGKKYNCKRLLPGHKEHTTERILHRK